MHAHNVLVELAYATAPARAFVQGKGTQAPPMHDQSPAGDAVYAVVPASVVVHFGRLEGDGTESATEYTSPCSGTCFASAGGAWLSQPRAAMAEQPNKTTLQDHWGIRILPRR